MIKTYHILPSIVTQNFGTRPTIGNSIQNDVFMGLKRHIMHFDERDHKSMKLRLKQGPAKFVNTKSHYYTQNINWERREMESNQWEQQQQPFHKSILCDETKIFRSTSNMHIFDIE